MCYNELVAELKDTVRHEIEHVTQSIIKSKPQCKIIPRNWNNFFLSKSEIPAYLYGFLTHARTSKISMNEIIDNFLKLYINIFTEKEINKIKRKWIKEGKKLLPNAKWK